MVSTPLIYELRKAFPNSKIGVGVGEWAKPLLENNPNISEILSCNAPWHNKQNCKYPANSPKTFLAGLLYVLFSRESKYIKQNQYSHGIDILGSRQGAWLMMRAKIPNRYGVKGYAGGDNWCQKNVRFKEEEKVAQAGLSFLQFFGVNKWSETRPNIYLTKNEKKDAQNLWSNYPGRKRVIIAPGGGFQEKCWGDHNFNRLIDLLVKEKKFGIFVIGSIEDQKRILIKKTNTVKICAANYQLDNLPRWFQMQIW